jgi:hypothetical protein
VSACIISAAAAAAAAAVATAIPSESTLFAIGIMTAASASVAIAGSTPCPSSPAIGRLYVDDKIILAHWGPSRVSQGSSRPGRVFLGGGGVLAFLNMSLRAPDSFLSDSADRARGALARRLAIARGRELAPRIEQRGMSRARARLFTSARDAAL